MPSILVREPFPQENMPQVGIAFSARNLGAFTIRVGNSFNGTWDFIIEAGPAAVSFKLAF